MTRVTEVLDYFSVPELVEWKLRVGKVEAKKVSNFALKIGTRVDLMIQADLSRVKPKFTSKDSIEVHNCWKAWEDFKKDYQPKIIGWQEEIVYEGEDLVGHLDLRTEDLIIDVKCAASIKPSYWLQASKYGRGQVEPAILRLDKNLALYEFKTASQAGIDWKEAVKVYDGLYAAYRFYNKAKGQEE